MNQIWCLHGFLGKNEDWKKVTQSSLRKLEADYFYPNLYPDGEEIKKGLLHFGAKLRPREKDDINHKTYLMGYSMGGRIALHSYFESPARWNGAIFISTNPGISDLQKRNLRRFHDQKLALAFLDEPWPQLMKNWNQQAVFDSSFTHPLRLEKNYSRQLLSLQLNYWSTGRQKPFWDLLYLQNVPILWISGSKDHEYTLIGEKLSRQNPYIQHRVIPNSGHRILWEQPEVLGDVIYEFITGVSHG